LKDIVIDLNDIDTTLYNTVDIRQGENLASEMQITLTDDLIGYSYILVFQLNENTPYVTTELTPVDDIISYQIPNVVTNKVGKLKVELQCYDDNGVLIKDAIVIFQVKTSITGTPTIMPEAYVPWFVRTVEEADRATAQADIATAQALISTTQAGIATTKASDADISADAALVSEQNAKVSEDNAKDSEDATLEIYNSFTDDEADRVVAENGRVSAEGLRVTADGNRTSAENIRISSEQNRVTAEGNRVTVEGNRVTAEGNRVTAENLRVTAESARALLEAYNAGHSYVIGNKVTYLGSTYQCILASTGNLPTNATYWIIIAQVGDSGTITIGSTNTAMTGLVAGDGSKIQNPTATQVGNLPMPDTGNYFAGDDKLGTQMQSVGAQLAQIALLAECLLPNGSIGNVAGNLAGWDLVYSGRLHIVAYGDSITEGAWSDASNLLWPVYGFTGRLQNALSKIYGDGGRGFIPLYKPEWSSSGVWTYNTDFGPYGYCKYAVVNTAVYTLANIYGDRAEIYYVNNNDMTITYKIDGGDPVSHVASAPFSNQCIALQIDLGSVGTHTIDIIGPTVGILFLQGASIYTGTTGVVVHNIGLSGQTAYATYSAPKDPTRLGMISSHFPPKLTIINYLSNDYNYQNDVNNYPVPYLANMTAIANEFIALGSKVIIWQSPDNNITPMAQTYSLLEYETASKQAAVSAGAAWLDIHEAWGKFSEDPHWMYDTQHPGFRGHKDISELMRRLIMYASVIG
jgi:hypothetical protein